MTVELALLATIINLVIGVPVGILAAVRQDSWADYLARSVGVLALAIPGFWLGTLRDHSSIRLAQLDASLDIHGLRRGSP